MKISQFLTGVFLFLSAGRSYSQRAVVNRDVARALKVVEPEYIREHISVLASDQLKGRFPGKEGYQMAVDYVVSRFKALGVEPAGENGGYLQLVRFSTAYTGADAAMSVADQRGNVVELQNERDFVIYPHLESRQVELEAPLVFAGFGISAPQLGYDDYASIDVKGKVVVVLRGAPVKFESAVAASSSNTLTILNAALAHGAAGVIIVPPSDRLRVPKGVNFVKDAEGKIAASGSYVSDKIRLYAAITPVQLKRLLDTAGIDLRRTLNSISSGTPASSPLAASIKVNYHNTFSDFNSYNVIGKISGSDPVLKNEYVVHTAHLDHLGISTPVKGDSIYNGAHDNASGVSCLLEIARIYKRLREAPKRSVLITMVSGEEMGLLGSEYFARHPTVPGNSIVADINTDMPTIIAPLLSVVALGAEHSTLSKQVAEAASFLGLEVEPDPEPEEVRFVRSDQYSFVRQGIPALHIKYGNKTADGKNNLSDKVRRWRETYYHKPQDDIHGIFDFSAGRTYTQLNFLISYLVAQSPERPAWNPGDYFGSR